MLRKIPKRQIQITRGEFRDIISAIKNNSYRAGHAITDFEDCFKNYAGTTEAVAVSSGRFALYLLLKHLGLKRGDKIIISAYNFKGVPQMLLEEGFVPLFIDADKDGYQVKIEDIEGHIDQSTKAIIVTHLFGQPCDLNKIMSITRKFGLFVIEDCAHTIGGYYDGKHVGSIGDAGFFSFTGSKLLNTSFGGMLITNNTDLAGKIRSDLVNYDFPSLADILAQRFTTYLYAFYTNKYCYSVLFYALSLLMSLAGMDPLETYKSFKKKEIAEKKMRFSNLQAIIGLRQMKHLNDFVVKRKQAANALIAKLDRSISLQKIPLNSDPSYFMFPFKAKDKAGVFKKLLLRGIDANLSYVSNCSTITEKNYLANAQMLSEEILCLSLPFDLEEGEIKYIAETINAMKHLLL